MLADKNYISFVANAAAALTAHRAALQSKKYKVSGALQEFLDYANSVTKKKVKETSTFYVLVVFLATLLTAGSAEDEAAASKNTRVNDVDAVSSLLAS